MAAALEGAVDAQLLLEGEILFGLGVLQHQDVTGGLLPRPEFVQRLREIVGSAGPVPVAPPVTAPRRTGRHLIGVVPHPADCFQPREVAEQLDAALANAGTAIVTQIISGLGGVGKTQIAADLARRAWDDGTVDVLVWANASSSDGIITRVRGGRCPRRGR